MLQADVQTERLCEPKQNLVAGGAHSNECISFYCMSDLMDTAFHLAGAIALKSDSTIFHRFRSGIRHPEHQNFTSLACCHKNSELSP